MQQGNANGQRQQVSVGKGISGFARAPVTLRSDEAHKTRKRGIKKVQRLRSDVHRHIYRRTPASQTR